MATIVEDERRQWRKVTEIAEYFGLPRSRTYDLIAKGELPAVRIGERSIRVHVGDAERFLREHRSTGPR